ncbi:MAG: hypothetical protein CM15mP74_32110 [Halieaceae bacterium]|nr:MAG: hypothetical protein CM15mP74_32110 [Halieaceae bacterium]
MAASSVFFCFMTIVAYSQGWGAALFERTWGWETSYYASINGLLLIICGPAAVLSRVVVRPLIAQGSATRQ